MIIQRIVHQAINVSPFCKTRALSTTPTLYLKQKWRMEQGLSMNPNARGVLTDSPDYSFLDGRLTPYGSGQKERIARQQEVRDQIIVLASEIDFAVDRYEKIKLDEEQKKQDILNKKLKPKGMSLK